MNIIKFLENRFQELKYETDLNTAFDIIAESEIKAVHDVLTIIRQLTQKALMPKILFDYALVQMKLKPEPIPILLNMIKKKKEEEEEAAKKELEKKVTSIQAVPNGPSEAG